MRIALLEMNADARMATGERSRALQSFLRAKGHDIHVIAPSSARLDDFYRFRFSPLSRLKRRALRLKSLPQFWDYVAEEIATQVDGGYYDVINGRMQPVAYALTRCGGKALKIFDAANVSFLETYHGSSVDLVDIDIEYQKEMEIYSAADYVFFHHAILADFFRRNILDSPKIKAVRMGCYPNESIAQYSVSSRLVYAGSCNYFQDPYLLSLVAKASPYPIDCYGHKDPNHPFLPMPLRYCGYRNDLTFLAEYQCGVITVSQDRLRRHSPSTKFADYFAAGLPVLFPDWMEEGHTYAAAVPFTESTFASQARRVCADRSEWQRLADEARSTAEDLRWDRVLQPLEDVLNHWVSRQ
jgi:hypothetical protein